MAKKKRGTKTSAPQHPPLENLLSTGESALYGQVCWSIANRGTESPRSGEVINLEGEIENGGQASRAFRLTRKSVENVVRCLGMRTCGEAIGLFVERTERAVFRNSIGGMRARPSGSGLRLHDGWHRAHRTLSNLWGDTHIRRNSDEPGLLH